jgi:hypothetical protein
LGWGGEEGLKALKKVRKKEMKSRNAGSRFLGTSSGKELVTRRWLTLGVSLLVALLFAGLPTLRRYAAGVNDMKPGLLYRNSLAFVAVVLSILFSSAVALGQTSSFTYQGRLTDGGTAANGNYDLQFALWDSLSGGTQVGSTQTVNTVAVSNGVFTVSLDFGANSFPGANRFLEIAARPTGGSFTLLTPRQPITSTPYAVRSLNASSADSVPVNGVPAGSGNYIQNATSPQSASNFNISGNGTAAGTLAGSVVNATTQFNIGGNRILSNPGTDNLFAGAGAGAANTTGFRNTFLGSSAGLTQTTAQGNTFIGFEAGKVTTGSVNTGFFNTFVGSRAGVANTTGFNNAFFGESAGFANTTGLGNAFFGAGAGDSNTTGDSNTLIGFQANVGSGNLTFATAIGRRARVDVSNALVLGSSRQTGDPDTNVGIGTTAPSKRLEVGTSAVADGINLFGNAPAYYLSDVGKTEKASLAYAGSAGLYSTDAAAGDVVLRTLSGRLLLQHGILGAGLILNSSGTVSIPTLANGGSGSPLCRNGFEISNCSSSLRYKSNVATFLGGLAIINRLRPISFRWKQDGTKDLGLGAEEVEKVEPLLTFRNDKGEIEGVKYNQLSAVFVNAIKEQQAQIREQQKEIEDQRTRAQRQQALITRQQRELEALKNLVCRSHARAAVCE